MSIKYKDQKKPIVDPTLLELEDYSVRLIDVLDNAYPDWRDHFAMKEVVDWVKRCWPLDTATDLRV